MKQPDKTYTCAELAIALGVSERRVRTRSTVEQWPGDRAETPRGKVYHYASLPADVKAAIARHKAAKQPKKSSGDMAIPEWSRRIGLARFQIVAAWRTYCRREPGRAGGKTELTATFLLAYNSSQLAADAFNIIGAVQKSSLYRWDGILKENGDDYHALCDRRGKWDKGGPRGLGQLTPEAERLFLSMWLTPNKPSVQLAHTGMEIILRREFNQEPPSMTSVYRFARRYDETCYDVVVLMREGEKALNDKVMPYIRRDRTILKVGDCLFADGHTLNFDCIHPETGKSTSIVTAGRGITWEMVLGKLKEQGLRDGIRTKEAVNKEALLEWGDDKLEKIGVKRKIEDKFGYDLKQHEPGLNQAI